MDHFTAIQRLRSTDLLALALQYAIHDRMRGDYFYDPFEIEYAHSNRTQIVTELAQELANPSTYQVRNAYVFYAPKNEFCDRRMTYIQIKDLTVRYAIAILFSNEIELDFHEGCFANRRAAEAEQQSRFTEDFATGGWARFAFWQRRQCSTNSVLLRTDLSSFYDSISHDYLIDSVCHHLRLPRDSELVQLFSRLLNLNIISYCSLNGAITSPKEVKHGLPIGDGVEGFLANVYLKDVGDAMRSAGACYGRYVDDIRLFGNSRSEVIGHLRILQERLLEKGLNLNASKTEIAENASGLSELMSRSYFMLEYGLVENENAGEQTGPSIDRQVDDFDRSFTETDVLSNGGDARDFCKFMNANHRNGEPMLARSDRRVWHVERLIEVITNWRGPTKHATWLIVQTASYSDVEAETRHFAIESIRELLADVTLNTYAKYRIVHHLIKLRQRNNMSFRYFDSLPQDVRGTILRLIPTFLAANGFELNLAGLHLARTQNCSDSQLRQLYRDHSQLGCEPVANALSLISSELPNCLIEASEIEQDEIYSPY